MDSPGPIYTADLFPPLHTELLALLRGLSDEDWDRPTLVPAWRVRDVAGHLLDVDLRKLSGGRDAHRSPALRSRRLDSFQQIVEFINAENASGVVYSARLSPRVLTDLLEVTGRWVSAFVAALPPDGEARIAVAWADEERSANWMDTGREYTERWHHQMQIRDAVSAPPLLQRQWLEPLLELSVQAFRRAYKPIDAPVGTAVAFEVAGDTGYAWSVIRQASGWVVRRGRPSDAAASVRTDADTAWKLLYNALSTDAAGSRLEATGDPVLTAPILGARSVMV